MSWYYNAAGQRYELTEGPLEPPDCWVRQYDENGDFVPGEEEFEQYDES